MNLLQYFTRPIKLNGVLLGCFVSCLSSNANGDTLNGFDLSDVTVPRSAIEHGGPPRDSIPSIDQPRYVTAKAAKFLKADDRVLGFELNGVARAYPLFILNWHEIVNDKVDKQAFVISYCPLCGTGMAFSAEVKSRQLVFGVSGLLYNSDVLFYDRQTESLWSQIGRTAISGQFVGEQLNQLPLQHTTWQNWQQQYPRTKVLDINQGFKRNYRRDPYRGYENTRRLFFDVIHKIPGEYHTKEYVLGVQINGKAKAYPFVELRARDQTSFDDELAGRRYRVIWDAKNNTARLSTVDGESIVSTVAFWFAWYAFYPDTQIFRHK